MTESYSVSVRFVRFALGVSPPPRGALRGSIRRDTDVVANGYEGFRLTAI